MKEKVLSHEVTMHYEVEELKVLLAKLFCAIGYFLLFLFLFLFLSQITIRLGARGSKLEHER